MLSQIDRLNEELAVEKTTSRELRTKLGDFEQNLQSQSSGRVLEEKRSIERNLTRRLEDEREAFHNHLNKERDRYRSEVLSLKRSIAATRQEQPQFTDDVLSGEMNGLIDEMQNWTINSCRSLKCGRVLVILQRDMVTNLPPVRLDRHISDETIHLLHLAMPMVRSANFAPPEHLMLQAILATKLELIFGNEGFGIPHKNWDSKLEHGLGRYFSGKSFHPN